MIAKLITFLQWIEGSEKPKKWFDYSFSFAFILMSISAIQLILKETIFRRSYSYMYDYTGSSDMFNFDERITSNLFFFSLTIFLLFAIIGSYIYGIYKKLTTKDFSIVRIIMNSVLPLTVGILLIYLHASSPSTMRWYLYLFGGLYALSPFILFSGELTGRSLPLLSRSFDLYKTYIVAFLIGLAIFLPLFFLGEVFDSLRYSDLGEIIIVSFFSLCGYGLAIWFILTYAWMEVSEVSLTSWRNILRGGVALAFIFLIIWLSPNWKTLFIENRIQTAYSILQKEGEGKVGLQKAADVTLLQWALKEQYQERRGYGYAELYAKLYDTSIESAIDESVDADKYKARNSNATTQIARGENAKVNLNFAKHDTEILRDIGAVKTTITYEFQNTSMTNQEVVYSIILPNTESVMTDLRLGLNLEYTGAIAPRGAAAKVYADSLRRNTDPALLEQTGPVSYRLRVFPVLSMNDPKTQGRQRVQYSYVSPLGNDDTLTLIPKTDILNLHLTDKSEILTRVTEGDKALTQDSKSGNDMNLLTDGKIQKIDTPHTKTYDMYCSVNTYPNIDMSKLGTSEKKLTKNIVFLDISKSVGQKKGIESRYQSLIDAWKDTGVSLDIFTYNSSIYPSGYNLGNLDFWGTTDMSKIIDYIEQNSISNANIVIVTDDESYERVNAEIKSIDYKKLKSNRISLIQVGEKVRSLKTEITKAILATDGSMLIIDEKGEISEAVKTLFATKKTVEKCENYTGSSLSSLQALQGYEDTKRVFGEDSLIEHIDSETILNGTIFSGGLDNPILQYLIKGSIIEGTRPIVIRLKTNNYEVLDNGKYLNFKSPSEFGEYRIKRIQEYTGSLITIQEYYPKNVVQYKIIGINNTILKSQELFLDFNPTQDTFQEEIAKTAHIINQSVSLIALETEWQKESLERYSEQEDKYDTKYENFISESPPLPSRREMMMDDRMMGPESMNLSASKSVTFNNGGYADGLKLGSSSSALSFGSSSSSGNGSMIEYIMVIVLFPLIAWFVLRRKPKTREETQKEEPKK